jgi:GT2 family glycosyltransferase
LDKKISFIISNYNAKKYTEFVYNSIRKNLGYIHEIVLLDDGSEDGTWELMGELVKKDHNIKIHRNEQNVGIAYSYNKMVELASNEIVCMLHSDMYVPPKFDEIMLKHMEEYDFITPLRVEPDVGYDTSIDKVLIDFGTKSEEFKETEFLRWHEKNIEENKDRVEQRMFFPWMTTKTLYNKVGGNDLLFLKYMVDDDDFYLRIKMSGAKYCQVFETAVYHMPSKSVRMREDNPIDTNPQHFKSMRNFIRKWGTMNALVWNPESRDMIIPKKYDIGFIAKNCHLESLRFLEPWCSTIYVEDRKLIMDYISEEQDKTILDLNGRVKGENKISNDIIVEFDVELMNQDRLAFLQRLTDIINDSGVVGEMQYDIFKLSINKLENIAEDNIVCKNKIIYVDKS